MAKKKKLKKKIVELKRQLSVVYQQRNMLLENNDYDKGRIELMRAEYKVMGRIKSLCLDGGYMAELLRLYGSGMGLKNLVVTETKIDGKD